MNLQCNGHASGGVVLFDLDGTLVDADPLHYQSWRDILAPLGVDLSLARYRGEIMGFSNDLIIERLLPALPASHAQAVVQEKEQRFRALATTLEPIPGVQSFLDWLAARRIPIGVVTNAPRLNAAHELQATGLADRFAALIIAEELEHGKPHPLPYLIGLQKLNGVAARSLAFEDSLSGVRAAKAAGLLVIGVTTGLSSEQLRQEGAMFTIADFTDDRLPAFCAAVLDGLAG